MIDSSEIDAILKIYKKHGWALRRVLLSRDGRDTANSFENGEIYESDIDGLWFSRPSRPGCEAWELRALTLTPLALLEVILDQTSTGERETILKNVEDRMREMLIRGRAENN